MNLYSHIVSTPASLCVWMSKHMSWKEIFLWSPTAFQESREAFPGLQVTLEKEPLWDVLVPLILRGWGQYLEIVLGEGYMWQYRSHETDLL